jgi:PIN domain nuclease of toxin-antitoxin system
MLIDTHVWIWWLTGGGNLSALERRALNASAEIESPRISAISLWEAQMLHSRRRFALEVPFESWLLQATLPEVVRVVPIDTSVILELDRMPPMHGDPADRLVVATARAHDLPLATHDRRIRKSRLVRLWKPGSAAS